MTTIPSINNDFFDFINKHKADDVSSLILKHRNKETDIDIEFAAVQIKGRQKNSKKLKRFVDYDRFIIPTLLSAEQSSHQAVASYHASLLSHSTTLLDMTAGLGIDVMTMSEKCSDVTAIEIDPLKAAFLTYNFRLLGISNVSVINTDSVEWVKNIDKIFDCIFIDPARRGEDNKRTYNFHDCAPDIISIQPLLIQKCHRLFIKASPLLDITQTLHEISNVSAIRAICVEGECKEILIESVTRKADAVDLQDDPPILKEAIDLDNNGKIISIFSYIDSGVESISDYCEESDIKTGHYLYEPNAAVMKLSPWKELNLKYKDLKKIAPSSHLFISDKLYDDFPGRKLRIEKLIEKKDRKNLKGLPVNVAVRNYPMSAEDLRKQLGVKEGRNHFIYGTRLKKPVLILADKI